MSVLQRNHVQVEGSGDACLVFAHGFGCDLNAWRGVAPPPPPAPSPSASTDPSPSASASASASGSPSPSASGQ